MQVCECPWVHASVRWRVSVCADLGLGGQGAGAAGEGQEVESGGAWAWLWVGTPGDHPTKHLPSLLPTPFTACHTGQA